jgi:hypothetical protein
MSWQDILKINVDEKKLRQLVSEEEFNELTQGETSDENLPQKITEDMDEDTQRKIRSAERREQSTMSRKEIADLARAKLTEDKESKKKPGRIAEPKRRFPNVGFSHQEHMKERRKKRQTPEAIAARKEKLRPFFDVTETSPYIRGTKYVGRKGKEGLEQLASKGKDWKDALQRRRQEISESGPSPGDRRAEARHAKQAEERKKRRAKAAEDKVIREQARQARIKAQKDKRDAKLQAQGERNKAAREKMFADMKRRDAAGAERRRLANDPAYRAEKEAKRVKAIEERRRTNPYGTAGRKTFAQPGRPSSENPNIQNPSIEAQRKQKELNEQTEKTTQALQDAATNLNKSVIKMNNDKYNTEQKSEPNKNFTPFVPLEKKRVMPEKQNKIPGVIQHSRPKRKKTENKW